MIPKKVIIAEDTINDIVEESNRHENVETGGLLFGKIIGEYIIILKIIHSSTKAKRTQVYFEMDEDFAINITKQMEKNNLAYLGNWHKHLGYGGPSNGDDKQAELFLVQNSHKRNYLSLIIDFYNNDYNLIATNYYFDEDEFIKKDIQIQSIINIQELNKIFKRKKFNIRNFIDHLSKNLEDHTGKTFIHSQSNKSQSYKLFYEEIYDIQNSESKAKNKIVYSVFIKFPYLNMSMADKISIGVTLDRKFTRIVEEIQFSDIFFNIVELLPKIKNMFDKSQYYIKILLHSDNKKENSDFKNRIKIIKVIFRALKSIYIQYSFKAKAKNVN
jgi:proteasome lid subunit RPN8/RPN11